MPKYKHVELNIKEESLKGLLLSYLSGYAPSRGSVARECAVSTVTSGKVANALTDSGFMNERQFSAKGERPRLHLFFRDSVRVLLVDLSSAVFKMSIVNAYGEVKFSSKHEYDTSLFPEENIEIFLSRCGTRARQSGVGFCAVSMIYADTGSGAIESESLTAVMSRPRIKEYINDALCAVFGRYPLTDHTVSSAICEAIKFKAHGELLADGGISYIFIGSHISLFHIYADGSVTVCSRQILIGEKERELLRRGMKKEDSESFFTRLSDFMMAAFSPSVMILESDTVIPDGGTEELLLKRCALHGIRAPLIYYKNDAPPLSSMGAVRSTLYKVISKYITSK